MGPTKIPYATRTWSPTTGCTNGCPTCWARGVVRRQPSFFGGDFSPREWPERLHEPQLAQKPQVILVSFMSDLFDPAISDEFLRVVFGTMHGCQQHTFLVLTQRLERMRAFLTDAYPGWCGFDAWPREYPNVWLGATVTDQESADTNIPILLQTPAAHRWVSIEPLLGKPDRGLSQYTGRCATKCHACGMVWGHDRDIGGSGCRGLDQVVLGCESGPNRRPMPHDWARKIRDQSVEANVPFFLKQMSANEDGTGKVIHAPFLDGKQHLELAWEAER